MLHNQGRDGLHGHTAVFLAIRTRDMFFLTTALNSQCIFPAAAVDDGFKRANLTATLVISRERTEVPPTTCNVATETSKIKRDIVLLHDEIMATNASFPLFLDDGQHLNKHLDFIACSVTLRNAVFDFS